MEKACTKCGEVKPLEEFVVESKLKSGRGASCKECHRALSRKYNEENRDKVAAYQKKYREENRDKVSARIKKYCAKNRDKLAAYRKKHYAENRDKFPEKNAAKTAAQGRSS